MPRHFLTARWSNLLLLTYAVPAERLLPRLPPGCSLDRLPGDPDTTAYVSLVAFDFLDTRVIGFPWPGYRNFPEINLRFYLRHGNDRGVAFIREFVPQRLTALMARRIYNEPYRAAPMTSRTTITATDLHIRHTLRWGGQNHSLEVHARNRPTCPPPDSHAHFFKEHRWGFGITRQGKLLRYEVLHPLWDIFPISSFQVQWNWSLIYGKEWAFLQNAQPYNTLLAAGSPITVSPKGLPPSPLPSWPRTRP